MTSAARGTGTAIRVPGSTRRATRTDTRSRPSCSTTWDWSEHFSAQPETLRYLQHVADRFDLRRDITFDTRVAAMTWDEETRMWTVALDDGSEVTARFVILATGVLSVPLMPDIPGVERFRGESFHTASWPHDRVDLVGPTGGRDRHRRHRRAAHHRDREGGRPSHGVPAHSELVRSAAQRADRCGRAGVDPRALRRDVRTVSKHVRRLHPRRRSTQGARGLRRGAASLSTKSCMRSRASASGWATSATCW